MTLEVFFAACRDGHSSHTFGYVEFDFHQGGFVVLLPTGILTDLNIVSQGEAFCKPGFVPVLNIQALFRSWEVA